MEKYNIALIKLFNAVQVESKKDRAFGSAILNRMVKNGYICEPSINATPELLTGIEELVGIGGHKMNATFHKSWKKIAKASDAQLFAEQILHYFTTYGFEALGIYNQNLVYIPREVLDIPVSENLPIVVIHGLTSEEVLSKIIELGSSGIALSQETIDNLMEVIKYNEYDSDFVHQIKNRELYSLLCDFYDIVPSKPEEYLRFVIAKLTGESLVIKNAKLIAKIKESDKKVLNKLILSAPDDLASIFFRYKPLFLAMKSISKTNHFFNRLRKDAEFKHKPMSVDYLNDITHQIKDGSLKIRELKTALEKYSVWRKIRLAYAIKNRLVNNDSIVYKVRNGKGWVADFDWNGKYEKLENVLAIVLKSIASDISEKVDGKTFYIPDFVNYALPATEKQFFGNIPANSYVSVDNQNLIVGIHWYNEEAGKHSYDNGRIDLDLSLLDVDGKYGWDRSYRNTERSVMFSGDVTDAPRPNGATELFYVENGASIKAKSMMVNFFNYRENANCDCQLIVAHESPKNFGENYMVNPDNIVLSQTVKITEKQNNIALIVGDGKETRVYFSGVSIGNSVTSRSNDIVNKARDFFMNAALNPIGLKDILEMAGAIVVEEVPEDGEYINLHPSNLDKTSIMGLFSK